MLEKRPMITLSPREEQLLKYAAEGLTDTAIALKLGISQATVGTYWGRVRIKIGPFSRTELVAHRMRYENEAAVNSLREENKALVEKLKQDQALGGGASFRDLLENAPDAMIVISSQGVIDYANRAALELFGYTGEELLGKDLLLLVPPRFRSQHAQHRADYILHPGRRQMGEHLETPALHKDGHEFFIRAALSATTALESTSVICAIRPSPQG
jgi:PAS domain S-box-containing protein